MDDLTLQEVRAFLASFNEASPRLGVRLHDVRFACVWTEGSGKGGFPMLDAPGWCWEVSCGGFIAYALTRREALADLLDMQAKYLLLQWKTDCEACRG